MRFDGPAIVERMGDTIVVPAFAAARVDRFVNVVLEIEGAAS
jgi:N-methylhydantoinase A/oxoprolinase/acetone carboxylase beta subunit